MARSDSPAAFDIARIGFVTRRFHELRGLIPASFGAGLIVGAFAEQAAGGVGRWDYWALQPLTFANIATLSVFVALDRGYRQTFGNPVATAWQRGTAGWFSFAVLAGGMVDVLQPRSVSLMAIALTACGLGILIRDWPWRIHYAAAAAAGVAAAVVSIVDSSAQGTVRVYFLIGLGMLAAAVADHRLLAASMGRSAAATAGARRRRSRYVARAAIAMLLAGAGTTLMVWDHGAAEPLVRLLLPVLLIVFQVAVAVPAAFRAVREFSRDGRVTEPSGANVTVRDDQLVLLCAAAFAGSIEAAFEIRGVLAFTLAAAFAGTGLSARPIRFHQMSIAALFAVSGLAGREATPSRGFGMLLIAASLAVLLSCFARRTSEFTDVHTI